MNRILLLVSAAILSTGCAAPLSTAISVSDALGSVASLGGERVNAAFARDDRACLWQSNGLPATTTLAQQRACLARVRAEYAKPLQVYDDFYAAYVALSEAVRLAEAAEVLGREPDLAGLEKLLARLVAAADTAAAFSKEAQQ